MTTDEPVSGAPAADWAGEIGAFAALLDDVERQLGDASWGTPLPEWEPPRSLAGPATEEDIARAQELLDRAEKCRVELDAQLRATATALDDLSRRRVAAQRYGATL